MIPLPTVLSDSTHGTIRAFELVTVRLYDADGAMGVGYTYTVGAGGAAVHALIAREAGRLLIDRDAERIEETFPEPDVTNCGGITVFMKVCHLAEAFHLPVTSHGAHDVTVDLLAKAPLVSRGARLRARRFRRRAAPADADAAIAPERPGHGVEFDWKALDAVRAKEI